MTTPLSIIVAYARKTRAIGHEGLMPWPRLTSDLKRFAQVTTPHSLIVGRRTFDTADLGGQALPHRRNIVLSRDASWAPPSGVVRAANWDEAVQLASSGFGGAGYDNGERFVRPHVSRTQRRHTFVIGGESVYQQALRKPGCSWVFATEVEGDWPGDTFFPVLDSTWSRVSPGDCPVGWAYDSEVQNNGIKFSFMTFYREALITSPDNSDVNTAQ